MRYSQASRFGTTLLLTRVNTDSTTSSLHRLLASANFLSNYTVQLQCLQRAPGRRVTEKCHFSTLNVGLAGTGNQTQATCLAGSVSRRSAIHYAYKLVFGRDPAQLLDLIFGRPPDRRDREPEKYVLEMRKRLDGAQSWARTKIGKYIRRKEWRYNAEKKVFQTGVKVWLFTPVVDSSTKRKLSNYWSGPWTVEKLTNFLYRIAPHNEWQTWMKVQVVGINRLKLYKKKKYANEPDPPIVEPPSQDSSEYPDDEFLLDWEDGAEGVEDPDMPYYLGGGGGGQPPPPPPPPPGPQGGGGGVPAHAAVVVGAGQGGVAPGAQPPPVQGDLDDVVQQPIGGGLAEAFPPPPQLPDLERVDDPDAPQGEGKG
jgi:hypothetical protein